MKHTRKRYLPVLVWLAICFLFAGLYPQILTSRRWLWFHSGREPNLTRLQLSARWNLAGS